MENNLTNSINVQSVCRLCLKVSDKLTYIFDSKNSDSLEIKYLIQDLCSIQLTEDEPFPKCVCKLCKQKLLGTQKFINICKKSDAKLHNIYQTQKNTNVDTSPNIISRAITIEIIKEASSNMKRKVQKEMTNSCSDTVSRNNEYENIESNLIANDAHVHTNDQILNNNIESDKNILKESQDTLMEHEYDTTEDFFLEGVFHDQNSSPCTKNTDSVSEHNDSQLKEKESIRKKNKARIERKMNIQLSKKNEKPISTDRYLCDICSKMLSSKSALRLHLKRHTGLKPYKCKFCNKGFIEECYKKRHELTHSDDKQLYMCHFCSASFGSVNGLKYHLMYHTGESRYSCNVCGKSFIRYRFLKEHIFTHTGEKPFSCKLCGIAYASSGSLFTHKKKCKLQNSSQSKTKKHRQQLVLNVYTNFDDTKEEIVELPVNKCSWASK